MRKGSAAGEGVIVLMLLGACSEAPQVFPNYTTDVYRQEPLRKVDVLMVIDNSGSMVEEQTKLAANFESFIESFQTAQVDYHIGVVTTDLANTDHAGTLQGSPSYITPETPDQEAVFAANVLVGTSGSGAEMGLEAARLALSDPLRSGANAGFYREEASLSLVILSDEDDLSPLSVDDYLNVFCALKGGKCYRNSQWMNISAVVGDAPDGCEADDGTGVAEPGIRYLDAQSRTGGVFASICSANFTPIIQQLGLDISGLRDEFPLTRCARTFSLEVTAGGRIGTAGATYEYLPDRKSIRFFPNWIPGPGQEIRISYEFYAEASSACPVE